jgi:hypothetical protein
MRSFVVQLIHELVFFSLDTSWRDVIQSEKQAWCASQALTCCARGASSPFAMHLKCSMVRRQSVGVQQP